MNCPYCDGKTKITESRRRKLMKAFFRRHECLECHKRFSTYEILQEDYKRLRKIEKSQGEDT